MARTETKGGQISVRRTEMFVDPSPDPAGKHFLLKTTTTRITDLGHYERARDRLRGAVFFGKSVRVGYGTAKYASYAVGTRNILEGILHIRPTEIVKGVGWIFAGAAFGEMAKDGTTMARESQTGEAVMDDAMRSPDHYGATGAKIPAQSVWKRI